MKIDFSRIALAVACLGMFVAANTSNLSAKTKTITIVNKTSFNVDRVYLSHVSEDEWGDDILGDNDVLEPGDSLEVEIECGEWDVKLIAADESTCTVSGVDICAADTWEITADC